MTEQQLAALRIYLKCLIENGAQITFRISDGRKFVGWVPEVGESAVFVVWVPSPFYAQATGTDEWASPDEWVPLADIDISSIRFWSEEAGAWIDTLPV